MTEASARKAAAGLLPDGPAETSVRVAGSADDVRRCWALLREFRAHLASADAAVAAWAAQVAEGYRLAYLQLEGEPVAAIGYRRMSTPGVACSPSTTSSSTLGIADTASARS